MCCITVKFCGSSTACLCAARQDPMSNQTSRWGELLFRYLPVGALGEDSGSWLVLSLSQGEGGRYWKILLCWHHMNL